MSDVIGPPVSRHKHPSVLITFPAFANNFCYRCSRVLEFVTGKPCFTVRVIFVTPKRVAASLPWTYVQSQWLPNLSYDGAQCHHKFGRYEVWGLKKRSHVYHFVRARGDMGLHHFTKALWGLRIFLFSSFCLVSVSWLFDLMSLSYFLS